MVLFLAEADSVTIAFVDRGVCSVRACFKKHLLLPLSADDIAFALLNT
jgi:hypothetical protein